MKQKTFFLVSQVLSFRRKKQTSKNVVDTTFKLFYRGSKRDTLKHLIYAKLIIVFTPNLEFSPYSEVIH